MTTIAADWTRSTQRAHCTNTDSSHAHWCGDLITRTHHTHGQTGHQGNPRTCASTPH